MIRHHFSTEYRYDDNVNLITETSMYRHCCKKEGEGKCCASPCLRGVRIFLLILIIIGIGLIATQRLWVPKLVDRIMRVDGEMSVPVREESSSEKPLSDGAVRVTSPIPQSIVTSPLSVSGEALGTWYFEGSFPVTLKDDAGRILGQSVARAQGEWMTTDFVPFQVTVDFIPSATTTGFLVFSKDNPSDLPENAAEVTMPVRFR